MSFARTRGMRTSRHKLHRANGGRRAPHSKTRLRPPQFQSSRPPERGRVNNCRSCGRQATLWSCPFINHHPWGRCRSRHWRDCGTCMREHFAAAHPGWLLVEKVDRFWSKRGIPYLDAVHPKLPLPNVEQVKAAREAEYRRRVTGRLR